MAEAGSSPTSTVARPGGGWPAATHSATSRATSPRTCAAIARPSMTVAVAAVTTAASLLLDRGVVGHQAALGPVAGEAHDHDAARIHARHDALAEGGVDDVVADPEDGRLAG